MTRVWPVLLVCDATTTPRGSARSFRARAREEAKEGYQRCESLLSNPEGERGVSVTTSRSGSAANAHEQILQRPCRSPRGTNSNYTSRCVISMNVAMLQARGEGSHLGQAKQSNTEVLQSVVNCWDCIVEQHSA